MAPTPAPAPARIHLRVFLRECVGVYRARIGFLLLAALLIVVPTSLLDTASEHLGDVTLESGDLGDSLTLATVGGALVFLVVATLGHAFYAGVVSMAAREARSGRPPPGLRQVLTHLPFLALLLADLLYTLVVAIGLGLVIVPGLVFGTWFALAAPVIELEGLGVRAAFRRSRGLVRDHFWAVLALVGGVLVLSEGFTALAHWLEEDLLGESLVADWFTAAVVDMAALPVYGVVVSVIALELIDLKGRPATDGDGATA